MRTVGAAVGLRIVPLRTVGVSARMRSFQLRMALPQSAESSCRYAGAGGVAQQGYLLKLLGSREPAGVGWHGLWARGMPEAPACYRAGARSLLHHFTPSYNFFCCRAGCAVKIDNLGACNKTTRHVKAEYS